MLAQFQREFLLDSGLRFARQLRPGAGRVAAPGPTLTGVYPGSPGMFPAASIPLCRSRAARKSATRQPGVSMTASMTGIKPLKAIPTVASTPMQVAKVPAESDP